MEWDDDHFSKFKYLGLNDTKTQSNPYFNRFKTQTTFIDLSEKELYSLGQIAENDLHDNLSRNQEKRLRKDWDKFIQKAKNKRKSNIFNLTKVEQKDQDDLLPNIQMTESAIFDYKPKFSALKIKTALPLKLTALKDRGNLTIVQNKTEESEIIVISLNRFFILLVHNFNE
jgi:hypothetical protein